MPRNLTKEEMDHLWVFNEDGTLTWKNSFWRRLNGAKAGSVSQTGYAVVTYRNSQYKIHRLVYAYHTGKWPKVLDHINRNKLDNRLANLREVSHADNSANVTKSFGKSKFRGVSFLNGRPRAFIQRKGRREFLGYFSSEKDASIAYEKRREELCNDTFSKETIDV